MQKLYPVNTAPIFPALGVFLMALCFFTLAFNINEFIAFQTRFGIFAQEMLRNGLSFFPTTFGNPYPDYPAGSIFIIWLFSILAGGLTPFIAILPTMIVSSLILMFIYKIGVLHSQRLGFIAVAMTLLALGFWQEARTISLDQYISLITLLTFYLLYRQKFLGDQKVWWIWIVLWSLAFVIRGPIGIVVPCAVACSFYLLELRWRDLIITGVIGLGLIIVWWHILQAAGFYQGGEKFLNEILRMQVESRVDKFSVGSLFFYFWRSFGNYALLYPICVLAAIFAYKAWWNKNTDPIPQLMRFSLLWALVILGGFSLASGKKSHYLLPMIPALGLFASCAWVTASSNANLERIRQLLDCLFRYIPLIIGLALIIVEIYQRIFHSPLLPAVLPANYFFTSLFLLTLFWVIPYIKNADKNLYATALTLGFTYIFIMEPLELYHNKTADFVVKLEEARIQDHAELAFYQIHPDALTLKYMVQLGDQQASFSPQFFDDWSRVENTKTPLWVIVEQETWDQELSLQQKKICKSTVSGNLGHNNIIVCKTD
jgi:4-amino-4-deoxy-L-arabinose transferase-like glycosyltransferase